MQRSLCDGSGLQTRVMQDARTFGRCFDHIVSSLLRLPVLLAAQQAIVQAYQQQYNFLTACGRATDSSNTYHYAFFACSYLADVLGKGIAFDPKVPSVGARVGTVTLVRNREGEG